MKHGSDAGCSQDQHRYTVRSREVDDRSRVRNVEVDDVRLDRWEVHGGAFGCGHSLGEALGMGMVVGEPLPVVVECVESTCSDDARLPESTAEELLEAPRVRDLIGGTREC